LLKLVAWHASVGSFSAHAPANKNRPTTKTRPNLADNSRIIPYTARP